MRIHLLLTMFLFACVGIFPRKLEVGPGKQFRTIKSGLSNAVNGDTVVVMGGQYKEGNIDINKSIVLLGKGNPVLDGEYKFEVVSVKSDGVSISGFVIKNSGNAVLTDPAAIKVYGCQHVKISNNWLENNYFGIYLQGCRNCVIRNNTILSKQKNQQSSGNAIHCWKSAQLFISWNRVSGHRDGIYFEFVTHSIINNNTASENLRYGLHFMFSNDDSYIGNLFSNNGAGVAVMFTHRVRMLYNTFSWNWGDACNGLLLKEISDGYLYGNRFLHNTTGVYMEGGSRICVQKNLFSKNGWGLKIQASCMDNIIRGNNFIQNTFDVSTNGSLVLSNFDGNYWTGYRGYDLNKDKIGDVPYHPLSLFSYLAEKNPMVMILFKSLFVSMLEESEKILPGITPDAFKDNYPLMQPLEL